MVNNKYAFRKSKAIKGLGVAVVGTTLALGSGVVSADEVTKEVTKVGTSVTTEGLPEYTGVEKGAVDGDPIGVPAPVGVEMVEAPEGKELDYIKTETEVVTNSVFDEAKANAEKEGVEVIKEGYLKYNTKEEALQDLKNQSERVNATTEVAKELKQDLAEAKEKAEKGGVLVTEGETKKYINDLDGAKKDAKEQVDALEKAFEFTTEAGKSLEDATKSAKDKGVSVESEKEVVYTDLEKAQKDLDAQLALLKKAGLTQESIDKLIAGAVKSAKDAGLVVTVGEKVVIEGSDAALAEANKNVVTLEKAVEAHVAANIKLDLAILAASKSFTEVTKEGTLDVTLDNLEKETARLVELVAGIAKTNLAINDKYLKDLESARVANEAKRAKNAEITKDNEAKKSAYDNAVAEYESADAKWVADKAANEKANADALAANVALNEEIDRSNQALRDKLVADTKNWEAEKREFEANEAKKVEDSKRAKEEAIARNNQNDTSYTEAVTAWESAKSAHESAEAKKVEDSKKAIEEAKRHNEAVEAKYASDMAAYGRDLAAVKPSNQAEVDRIKAENAEIEKANAKLREKFQADLAAYEAEKARAGSTVEIDPVRGAAGIYREGRDGAGGSTAFYKGHTLYNNRSVTKSDEFAKPFGVYDDTQVEGSERKLKDTWHGIGPEHKMTDTVIVRNVATLKDGRKVHARITPVPNTTGGGSYNIYNADGAFGLDISGGAYIRWSFFDDNNKAVIAADGVIISDIDDNQRTKVTWQNQVEDYVPAGSGLKVDDGKYTRDGYLFDESSIPQGSYLSIGYGSYVDVYHSSAYLNLFGPTNTVGTVTPPVRPTEPTYTPLKTVPTLVEGTRPTAPTKGNLVPVPVLYVAKPYGVDKPTKGASVAVPDVYVAKTFSKPKPVLSGVIRDNVPAPKPIPFTEVRPTRPTEPTYLALNTNPDVVIVKPTYHTLEVPMLRVVTSTNGVTVAEKAHDIKVSVETNNIELGVKTHEVSYLKDTHVFKDKETPKAEVKAEVKETPKSPEGKILPKTGDAGSISLALGSVLSTLGVAGLKRKRK